ncbi:MAG: hypothetical protein KDC98_10285 [Planctomycetes bacterium]|nr:hypothetical protein [Planctomycetota bacterium]
MVYPGTCRARIVENVEVVPLRSLARGGPEVLFPEVFDATRARRRPPHTKK